MKKDMKSILPALTADECVVDFDDNAHGIYLSGELMSGKIILLFKDTKTLKGIKLDIFGKAQCGWKQIFGRNMPVTDQNEKCKNDIKRAQRKLFHWSTYLMEPTDGSSIEILALTAVTFNFAFQLFKNCPGSFEGKFGYIRYFLKVTLIHSNDLEQSREVRVIVQQVLDLNKESALLKVPTIKESFENMCYIPPDNLGLTVKLPKSAYVLGEIIPVTVTCRNSTSLYCKHVFIFLEQVAQYTVSNSDSIKEKKTLTKLACGPVFQKESKTFVEAIRVPATPLTNTHICEIIQISYYIRVTTCMQFFMRNATAKIPITIGNVAYNDTDPNESNISLDDSVRTQTPNLQPDIASIISNSEGRAPPSYEESLSMSTSLAPSISRNIELSESVAFGPQVPAFSVQNGLLPSAPNLPKKSKRRQRKSHLVQENNEAMDSSAGAL